MATATQTPTVIPALKPQGLIELLSKAIPKRRPVLVAGAPGIGKSDIVAQVVSGLPLPLNRNIGKHKAAAKANGWKLIVSHPAVADPTDFKGLPWFDGTRADFRPIGEF